MKAGLADSPVERGDYLVLGAMASGANHTLALKANGTGQASLGQERERPARNGTTVQSLIPVSVTLAGTFRAVAGGTSHSLGLKSDGTVWAWGWNSQGQLGDGTTTQRTTPIQTSLLTNVIAIAAGDLHSLAVKSDGTVWAWGVNGSGQLGDGTTTTRKTPVQVSGLTGALAVAAGNSHSLCLKADGTVAAWGNNSKGQLGDGTTTNRQCRLSHPESPPPMPIPTTAWRFGPMEVRQARPGLGAQTPMASLATVRRRPMPVRPRPW